MMKDIFLIDADETVLDFRRTEREALAAALRAHAIDVTEELSARYHAINDGLWKRLERREITRERLVVERFETLFSEYGIGADAAAVSAEFFEGVASRGYLLEGAEEFLRALKARGRIYFVTNGAKYTQENRFKRAGLNAWADGVFVSEAIGVYKPSEAYAEYVETHVPDYDRARAVWVGDSLTSDMACAATKSIDFILYAPNGAPAGYEGLCAQSYADVLDAIGRFS
ncbi:MAG: YjjG family noncanonical pyrimidine nucleotidase [Candidatus Gallimonas sp.]